MMFLCVTLCSIADLVIVPTLVMICGERYKTNWPQELAEQPIQTNKINQLDYQPTLTDHHITTYINTTTTRQVPLQ
jgi:hypothetical protein